MVVDLIGCVYVWGVCGVDVVVLDDDGGGERRYGGDVRDVRVRVLCYYV